MADKDETPKPEETPAPKRRRTRQRGASGTKTNKATSEASAAAPDEPKEQPATGDGAERAAHAEANEGPAADASAEKEDMMPEDDPIVALQREILDAALPDVSIDGWSRETLAMAATRAGFAEGDAERAFPRGAIDAVLAYIRLVDADMVAEMDDLEQTEPAVYENMRTREKIAIAIQVRLESQTGNREAIRRSLRVLADPRYAPEAAKSLADSVDAIWRIAGDTSTDFNYYTKRGLLAGVYSATLMYWLNDGSEDQHKTWEFMRARIGEILRVGQAAGSLGKIADRLPNPFRLCGSSKRRWREGPVYR